MSDELAILRTSPVLSNLTEEELSQILKGAEKRDFETGELLIEEGTRQDFMLFIVRGKTEVTRGHLQIALREGCQVLGEMGLVDPCERSATVVACSKGCLYELPRRSLWTMIRKGHPAAVKLLQNLTVLLCERLQEINQMVQHEVIKPEQTGGTFGRLWQRLFGKGGK